MPARQIRCPRGVEPRFSARRLRKNRPPRSSRRADASDHESPSEASTHEISPIPVLRLLYRAHSLRATCISLPWYTKFLRQVYNVFAAFESFQCRLAEVFGVSPD